MEFADLTFLFYLGFRFRRLANGSGLVGRTNLFTVRVPAHCEANLVWCERKVLAKSGAAWRVAETAAPQWDAEDRGNQSVVRVES